MNNKKILPYASQSISSEDIEAVSQALAQPMITRGPLVESFEKAIAEYCGATYGIAFNSGTTALMAAYFAAKMGSSDRILTTPNTFVSTVGSGMQYSATPVFLDIDRTTGNVDLEQLKININQPISRGKTAIVPVHFAGIPVDMQAIDQFIADPNTMIIEDAAHALGSKYKDGQRVGCCAWSHMTIFSFHPAKNITTGEGGMVMTNDESLAHQLRLFRNNCIERTPKFLLREPKPWYYEAVALSGNYNFTEMQAALGLSQLKRLDTFIAKRQELLNRYKEELASVEHVRMFSPDPDLFVVPNIGVVQIDFEAYKIRREHVMKKLKEQGIMTQVHYIPVYHHPLFVKKMGTLNDYFPEMESYYAQALTLPLFFDMEQEDVARVVNALKEILRSQTSV